MTMPIPIHFPSKAAYPAESHTAEYSPVHPGLQAWPEAAQNTDRRKKVPLVAGQNDGFPFPAFLLMRQCPVQITSITSFVDRIRRWRSLRPPCRRKWAMGSNFYETSYLHSMFQCLLCGKDLFPNGVDHRNRHGITSLPV